jgi:hypothetical protein
MNSELHSISSNRRDVYDRCTLTPSPRIQRGVAKNSSFGKGIRNGFRLISNTVSSKGTTASRSDSSAELSFDDGSTDLLIRRKSIMKRRSGSFDEDDNTYDKTQQLSKKQQQQMFQQQQQQGKKQVRFNTRKTKVYKIPTFFQYASDLWWSHHEIEQHKVGQSDFTNASNEVKAIAKLYLRAYRKGQREILDHCNGNNSSSNSNIRRIPQHQQQRTDNEEAPKLSLELYKDLVSGRSNGFAGLELYAKSTNNKKQAVKEVITSIVQTYRDNVAAAEATVPNKQHWHVHDDTARHAQSLTRSDRSWAFICGQADEENVEATQN